MRRQTGIRIDRALFEEFRQLCANEKQRPGEAVETLLQLAINAGRITGQDTTKKIERTILSP